MALWRKRSSPIDRAVEDLDRQIASLQKQLREVSSGTPTNAAAPANGASRGGVSSSRTESAVRFIKDMLTPPERKPLASSPRVRRDLFDVPSEPLKDLEPEPIAFSNRTAPDLFAGKDASTGVPLESQARTQIDCSIRPDERLVHYLSAGSIRTYKPLKHVQRETRNRFFMWLGLSLLALWVLYVVIR